MPVIDLVFLGRSIAQRQNNGNNSSSPTTAQTTSAGTVAPPNSPRPQNASPQRLKSTPAGDPPPPYTPSDSPPSYTHSINPCRPSSPALLAARLRLFIIEIIALNVSAPMSALRTALYGPNLDDQQHHSILSPAERHELFELSHYLRNLYEDFKIGTDVREMDLRRWKDEVLDPYRELIPSDWPVFALDLLLWYADAARAASRTKTGNILPWFETGVACHERVRGVIYVAPGDGDKQLARMMQGFDFLIRRLSVNEEVLKILTKALDEQNREMGFRPIKPSDGPHVVRRGTGMFVLAILDGWSQLLEEDQGRNQRN